MYNSFINRFLALFLLFFAVHSNLLAVKFYSVNSIFGISTRITNSICKDDNGFIWASSKTGVMRLTDSDYRIYNLPYETTGAISVNLIYQRPNLVAYTNNGQVFNYNPISDRFDLVLNLNNNSSNVDVYTILLSGKGDYWIASNLGLYLYRQGKLLMCDKISEERFSIAWYDDQHLIITTTGGIRLFDTQTLQIKPVFDIHNSGPFIVSSLFVDKEQNTLWMGTLSNGLFSYNFRSKVFSHILSGLLPKQPVLAIEESSDSTLLLGIDGQGIWEIRKNAEQILTVYKENSDDPYSLRGNGVYTIFNDGGKRIWVGSISGGVSFFELGTQHVTQVVHQTNNSNSLVNNDVNSIYEDSTGKIWFATNNGISCWDKAKDKWSNYFGNKLEQAQVFLSLSEDGQGRIWAGSYSSGVYVLDRETGRQLAHYSSDIADSPEVSNFIMYIFKDSQGDLWVGGVNGKYVCYLSKEGKFRIYTEKPLSSFAELAPNQILLGFSYGISLLNKQTGEIKNLLTGLVAQDMLVLNGDIWICTSGDGLVKYHIETGETKKFTTQSGVPSNFINSIAFASGYLWVGTEGGLCRIDPKNETVLTFSSIFPLSGLSYNKSSVCRLKNGQLVWGTNNGAVFFDPASITEAPSVRKIFFQDLMVSGRSIREISSIKLNKPVDSLQSINLKYFQNTISLELLPIGVLSGAKFTYKLDGFDKNWNQPTNNRFITYTNLPSGKFTLKVKLLESSTSKVLSERAIVIHLIPPFWRTAWFWILATILVTGIIFLYLLYYINSLKQKHTEEKIQFFTQTAHDIRTSLTLIKAPVEELNKETGLSVSGRYYLTLALDQARKLTSVVTQLMDFQKVDVGKEHLSLSNIDIVQLISNRVLILDSFAQSKHVELVFSTNSDSYETAVDETKMEKVIDNLISNAVKYSYSESQVLIKLECSPNQWALQVTDHGIGISRKAQRKLFKEFYRCDNAINSKVVGSGIGLLLVKNYVTMHGGSVRCESQENSGSTFQIVVPFRRFVEEKKVISPAIESEMPVYSLMHSGSMFIENENQASKEMKVLVVEDNEDLLNFMVRVLSSDFKVFSVSDGAKAWEFILKHEPDLVVSDVMMPNMDGFELCQTMKSTWETSHIPIVLLTALSGKAEQLHGLGLGADDYLTKPFDMNLLVQRIKSIIRNREVVREKALKLIKVRAEEPVLSNELNDKFVKKMMEVVKANLANAEFNKDEFASAMNISSSLLYKKIKSLTNQSPTDFIKTVRLNHALELLQSRNYTVTEVSELCGFASIGYFSTVFKKHYGKSPTEILE